ncbi:hypothetical protein BO82DRAFT_45285 [Aspergillus uvarum CBS 121591]|uniref:Uncharacterized protein n=1 Tax=Aspergillus uvarum CBS 121591 TaxID=1448315 RepID=A0A319CFH0_9EURO|nr:hypothetical protein BO82DRAFT_45285 [Aspergillus uvarum CBS 121591]PYH83069.1 hypothetical protein BO82DRAFT_45285 [Aspergillus uvarum CBS 121591]
MAVKNPLPYRCSQPPALSAIVASTVACSIGHNHHSVALSGQSRLLLLLRKQPGMFTYTTAGSEPSVLPIALSSLAGTRNHDDNGVYTSQGCMSQEL